MINTMIVYDFHHFNNIDCYQVRLHNFTVPSAPQEAKQHASSSNVSVACG